jgi:hypothetical protein
VAHHPNRFARAPSDFFRSQALVVNELDRSTLAELEMTQRLLDQDAYLG